MGKAWSPYHPPRPAPGEVTAALLHQYRQRTCQPSEWLATWNVRTMRPSTGLSDDLQQVDDTRKTAIIIDHELAKRNIDIAALQETHLASSGSLKEKDYTFFWQTSAGCTGSALQRATPSRRQLCLPLKGLSASCSCAS